MTWDDQELARFSSGLRRRYHVWYEQDERARRHNAIGKLVCALVAVGWLAALLARW